MKTYSQLITYVQNQIEDDSTYTLGFIKEWINITLDHLCENYRWPNYVKTEIITPDSNGEFYMPPAFLGILSIRPNADGSSDRWYFQYQQAETEYENRYANPYYKDIVGRVTTGATDTATAITNGATTVTTSTSIFASTDVGEALLIGDDGYEYEITAYNSATSVDISPAYRGASATVSVYLRPEGVRAIKLFNESGEPYTDDVEFTYKVRPQHLYNDYDRPLIDADEAIQKGALIEAMINEKYNIDAQRMERDFFEAVSNALKVDSHPKRVLLPKGTRTPLPAFSFGTNRSTRTIRRYR